MAFCSVATQMIMTYWQCDWMNNDWLTNSTMMTDVCKYIYAFVDIYVCMCVSMKLCIFHISLFSFIIHGLGIYKTRRNFWLVFISSHHNFFFLCFVLLTLIFYMLSTDFSLCLHTYYIQTVAPFLGVNPDLLPAVRVREKKAV